MENEKWFLDLDEQGFKQMCVLWIKHHNGIELPKLNSYDEWLNYFKTLPPLQIKALGDTGQAFLTTEAYAALTRWGDIIKSPHRIDKIYQAGLTKPNNEKKSITELAKSNDKLGLLYAIRDQIAEKLEKGTGARDTANLAREMSEILDQISEAEKRQGPQKDTKLAELLAGKPKKAKGARNGSFKAHTIAEVEGD